MQEQAGLRLLGIGQAQADGFRFVDLRQAKFGQSAREFQLQRIATRRQSQLADPCTNQQRAQDRGQP